MSKIAGVLWQDRKRTLFGLPLSFTKYILTGEKLIVKTGFISIREEEVRLYRIMDISLKRTLGERLFGVGSIRVCSADKTTPEFTIKSVKSSATVKNMLSDLIEKVRQQKRILSREYMGGNDDAEDELV